MKLVLTNDDGIQAPGIEALERACQDWCDLVIVAPDRCHSSKSHHVTTGSPIAVTELGPARFRIAGSPADCVRLARTVLALDAQWLVSGINQGGNLGVDSLYSGTIAAAREAALLGWRAIAISHYVARGREVDWLLAGRQVERVLRQLMAEALPAGNFWNVNLPHPPHGSGEPELVFCPLDPSPLPVSFSETEGGYRYSGDYQSRDRLAGHDVAECFAGKITVTRLSVLGAP